MRYNYERQRSVAAFWSYRLAVFLLPYFLIVILGHRSEMFETPALNWLLGIGFFLATLSLICGIAGFHDLWIKGKFGGLRTTWGTLLSIAILMPLAWTAWLAVKTPPLYDIVTDPLDAPEYDALSEDDARNIKPLSEFNTAMVERLRIAYPKISSRRYRASADRVYSEAVDIAEDWGWRVVEESPPEFLDLVDSDMKTIPAERGATASAEPASIVPKDKPVRPAELEPEDTGDQVEPVTGEIGDLIARNDQEGSDEPSTQKGEQVEGYLEAIAFSRVLKVKSDVIIRVVQEEETSLVDMRSTSRWQKHDLGENARHIIDFMEALDDALAGVSGKESVN